jgi:N-acetylmuramoyl-L-alanine amidase
MKRKLFIYIIWALGVLLLGFQPAIGAEPLSKQLGLRIKTIMLDPWYGGEEKGPLIGQKYGKDITLEIAQKLQGQLEASGFKVYLTRTGDRLVPLEDRVFQGKSKGADVHLAIKVSLAKNDCIKLFIASLPIKEPRSATVTKKTEELGTELNEIFGNLVADDIREESLLISKIILDKFKEGLSTNCVELRKGKDYILKNAQSPTVMVDFSISPTAQKPFTLDTASLDKIAGLLADSIKQYSDNRAAKTSHESPNYWCPIIAFVGKAAKIFTVQNCEYISGITIKLVYNGVDAYPAKLKFTLLDTGGNKLPIDQTKHVSGPARLEKGQYGIFTIQYKGNDNPSKIEIEGVW